MHYNLQLRISRQNNDIILNENLYGIEKRQRF
jgi:hypothetical protein